MRSLLRIIILGSLTGLLLTSCGPKPAEDTVDVEVDGETALSLEESSIDFESYESYTALESRERAQVRQGTSILLEIDPAWRKFEEDLKSFSGPEELAELINALSASVQAWKPKLEEYLRMNPDIVPGGPVDVATQEITSRHTTDMDMIMVILNDKLAVYGTEPDVQQALTRLTNVNQM